MTPSLSFSLSFLFAASIAVAACETGVVPSSFDDTADAGRAPDGTFDPTGLPKTCSTSADCVLVPFIGNCTKCCGQAAIRANDDVLAELRAVERACKGRLTACLMACEESRAECVEGACVVCTEQPCNDGIMLDVQLAQPGRWVVEAKIDNDAVESCSIDLPSGWPGPSTTSCSVGMELQGGRDATPTVRFRVTATTAKTVAARVTHDGVEIVAKTYILQYEAVPGPNGPGCAPEECRVAAVAVR